MALATPTGLNAAEAVRLDAGNFDGSVPAGKEVDAIYGDYLLQGDARVAVVAAPGRRRHANLTVRNVGGCVIDFTESEAGRQNDQLGAFYPLGGAFQFREFVDWPEEFTRETDSSATIALAGSPAGKDNGLRAVVGYENPGDASLRVTTRVTNQGDSPAAVRLEDGFRCDGEFVFGFEPGLDLWWAQDVFWGQAYGLQPEGGERVAVVLPPADPRTPRGVAFPKRGEEDATVELAPGESVTFARRLISAGDTFALRSIARRFRGVATSSRTLLKARDEAGPVAGARVELFSGDQSAGVGSTNEDGELWLTVPAGSYRMTIAAQGYAEKSAVEIDLADTTTKSTLPEVVVRLPEPGYVEAEVTDGDGGEIPAKVEFIGLEGAPTPNWGPDSGEFGVGPLRYTPDGKFRVKLLPGKYRYVASHGPEYDAAIGELNVEAGETARLEVSLPRSVDTTGWLSAELHSHSSPSGDNTASQLGRVLNLVAEQIEFAPCTEHQRIDIYDPCLKKLGAERRMLTCPGMECTGQPLPLNHQNAFPLLRKPHEQDNGAPETSSDPVQQIERLARWDDDSDKYVQTNHPNIAQMVGDRDLDGKADGGFEPMFGFMDAFEVHPPGLIFTPLGGDNQGVGHGGWEDRGNIITNWLQLLNLGYRVTAVVNTDAHYNNQGSGWLRNWVRSKTDEPTEARVMDLVHEFEHGHVVVSNGPFLEVEARHAASGVGGAEDTVAIPGDDLEARDGRVRVRVRVACPNWLEVNRVQLFLNGRPVEEHNYTARANADWFGSGAETFDRELDVTVEGDTHIVVAVCGEGRKLGAVYGPVQGELMPVAVANPVFVDVDGDKDGDGAAFEANGDDLGVPLPVGPDHRPSHGHTHHNHTHER